MKTEVLDVGGVYGTLFNYSIFFFFFGTALFVFIYFWRKGALDMNEEPAIKMLQDEEENS